MKIKLAMGAVNEQTAEEVDRDSQKNDEDPFRLAPGVKNQGESEQNAVADAGTFGDIVQQQYQRQEQRHKCHR